MIYQLPSADEPIDQGDLLDACPVADVASLDLATPDQLKVEVDQQRIIVVTQTCDLANQKVDRVVVAAIFDAQMLVDRRIVRESDVKGPIRATWVWGLYFLPASPELGLNEMIVDLRRLHTVRLHVLRHLCESGKRRARLQPVYREHLAKHFADTYSRIGLPEPYETIGN
jgi:hypothetical protein